MNKFDCFWFTIGIILGIGFTCLCAAINSCNTTTSTSPVEKNDIDSLKDANNLIIIQVEQLDSIKDVKIKEVKNLDNDSTLKLFYELIRK